MKTALLSGSKHQGVQLTSTGQPAAVAAGPTGQPDRTTLSTGDTEPLNLINRPGPAPTPASTVPSSYPARIIIIRHAEKPNDPSDPGLTPQGQERAQALATILPERYPNISYIFAARQSAASNRPVLTITPTAQKLGLPINENYSDNQFAQVAHTLLTDPQYAGKTIAIAWHHGEIPQLAQALGVTPPQDPWPGKVFDRIWQIDYSPTGQASVQNLPQNALPGDSPT